MSSIGQVVAVPDQSQRQIGRWRTPEIFKKKARYTTGFRRPFAQEKQGELVHQGVRVSDLG